MYIYIQTGSSRNCDVEKKRSLCLLPAFPSSTAPHLNILFDGVPHSQPPEGVANAMERDTSPNLRLSPKQAARRRGNT